MSAITAIGRLAARRTHTRVRGRIAVGAGELGGVAAIALLLPLRHVWLADVVLMLLSLTVPGVIALRALGVPAWAARSYPIYVPAASLLVIMVGSLAADLVAPQFGIAKPLQGDTIAVATLLLTSALWLIGLRAQPAAGLPWSVVLERPALLAPLALPVLAAAGALLLTNGHGALLARCSAIVTVLALLGTILLAQRFRRGQVAMLLFGCALAAEWAFSLRSHEVIGYDIATEIHLAQSTFTQGVWHPGQRGGAYGAMLSITLLPSALKVLTGVSPLIAFKVVFPVFTAMIPVSVFLMGQRFMRRGLAAGAASLLIIESYFFQVLPQLARQEVGLLFFAVLVFALVDQRLARARLRVIGAVAMGLIVSHYSSSYLAIVILLFASLIELSHKLVQRRALTRLAAPLIYALAVLVAGATLWDGAITHSADNVSSLTSRLEERGLNLLPNAHGNLISAWLSGNTTASISGPRFEQLAVGANRGRAGYVHPLRAARDPRYVLRTASVPVSRVSAPGVANEVSNLSTIVGQLMLVSAVLGAALMLVRWRATAAHRALGTLALATVALLAVIRLSGTVAGAYGQERALDQALIVLALPAAWLTGLLVRPWDGLVRRALGVAIAFSLALVFADQLGVTAVVLGGGTSLNLSQSGEDFERQFTTTGELAGASWANTHSRGQILYSDRYGQLRFFATSGRVVLTDVTPETLDRHAWVYGTRTNVVLGRARGQIGGAAAIYRWPNAFLNRFFDVVYTDGVSKVYHR